MKYAKYTHTQSKRIFFCLLLLLGLRQQVNSEPFYQINGFYLGATPEELGVQGEKDFTLEEKYHEVGTNGVTLFFIRVDNRFRVYRIVKEEPSEPKRTKLILDSLKEKYGTPDKQQIKTSSVRPQNQMKYSTIVKNRALWNISASQDFIAEVESHRIVFELIDNNPQHIKAINKSDSFDDEGFTIEGWDPDY